MNGQTLAAQIRTAVNEATAAAVADGQTFPDEIAIAIADHLDTMPESYGDPSRRSSFSREAWGEIAWAVLEGASLGVTNPGERHAASTILRKVGLGL